MNGRIIAQDHKDLPLRWPASFQKVKQTTIATFCNMKKQSVYQNVVDGVYSYGIAIKGMGAMSGKAFADQCRKVWTDKNLVNAHYYALFENYIDEIERGYCTIRVRYKNLD